MKTVISFLTLQRDPGNEVGQIFVYFAKKICHHFRDTSAHTDFFFPTKFCQASSSFRGTRSSLSGTEQIAVRYKNRTDFTIYTSRSK